jgi:hypothetical protein
VGSESIRNWLAYRMDSVRQYRADLGIRPARFSQVNLFVQHQQRTPVYGYSFITASDALGLHKTFTATEVGIQWRYARNESYIQIGNGKAVTKVVYPQINFLLSRGMNGVWNGQYDFTKMEVRVDQQWIIRRFGKTTVQFDAGKVIGAVPYPFLFNGKGANLEGSFRSNFVVNNYFQTMALYEFASDQFVYLFLNHNFGRITGNKLKYFRPELSIVQNSGVGSLQNLSSHQGVVLKTMNKGFYETGLMFSNLLRFKYLNVFYYGLGVGAFYRYGPYELPNTSDNLAYKIIISISF